MEKLMNSNRRLFAASLVSLPFLFNFYPLPASQSSAQKDSFSSLEEKASSLTSPKSLLSIEGNKIPYGEQANFRIRIDRSNLMFNLFHESNGSNLFLFQTPVALGRKGFSTPAGEFYVRRIVHFPRWFPPKWAKTKKIPKPGKDNPYGLWMAELFTTDKQGEYEPWLPEDSMIRFHSTNEPSSIGTYSSHGCIRLHPNIAEELFPFFLDTLPHGEGKKTSKGIIYPLKKAIPVLIK